MASSKGTAHNNFFLTQFRNLEFAVAFFQEYVPTELKEMVDWEKFRLAPGDFVQKALQNRRSDLLYETRIAGRKGFLYLHLEHQRKPVLNMAYRMLIYQAHIWQQHEKQYPQEALPLIYPMVLYQGKRRWTAPLSFHDYMRVPEALRPFVPAFRYAMLDLSHLSDEAIKGEIIVQIALLVMKHIDSSEITELLFEKLMPLIQELEQKETGLEYLETILYYLSKASPHLNKEQVIQKLQEQPESESNTMQEIIMTLAEQWIQEGQEKGRQEGQEEEREATALRLLKMGMLTHEQIAEVTCLSLSKIRVLAQQL